jgi:hypothetical protein
MTISTRALKSGHWGPLTILFAAVLLAASPLIAAVDEEIEVISYPGVSDDIYNPQAAASWGCGFVVAYNAHVQDENHVFDYLNWGRRFTSYAAPLDVPFQINALPGDIDDFSVSIDMTPNGAFVAAWLNRDVGPHLRVQRFSAFGDRVGDLIYPSDDASSDVVIGVADSGAFVVAHWAGIEEHLLGHIYNAIGDPVLSPFTIETASGFQALHDIAVNPNGTFVVTWSGWQSPGTDDDGMSIQARCFTASGTPVGDQFQVNTVIEGDQRGSRVAIADSGAFVVVWRSATSAGSDDSGKSIQMRRYSSACVPLDVETQVNTYVNDDQDQPDIIMSPGGTMAVVWRSTGNWDDQSSVCIQARLFNASGQALGDQFPVNLSTGDAPQNPTISGNPDRKYVIAWKYGHARIKARVFNAPGVIFTDFFESGGFWGWNFATP